MGLIRHFVRHPTAANLVMALMLLFGVLGALGIRAQLLPDTPQNTVTVSVVWPGAGPEEVDRGIVQALEPALRDLSGVERLVSNARRNRADLTLHFSPRTDLADAADEVAAAIAAVATLPRASEPPTVTRRAAREQVTDLVIHGPVPRAQIVALADELADRLRLAGLSRVTVMGAPAPHLRIAVPEPALIRHDLTLREVSAAVAEAARSHAGGETGDGVARLRAGAERRSEADLADVILRPGADGPPLRLGDVAQIEDVGPERGSTYVVAGHPAAIVRVQRDIDGDALRSFDAAMAVMAQMAPTLPAGVEISPNYMAAGRIADRLAILIDNALTGLALVLALLFLFLNARTAFWVAAGIPAALLAAVGLMWVAGVTLNLLSIFALIIVLGMVVDDAIVVGEHADARARAGLPPIQAAEAAARRMAAPVIAATITTVIAFAALLVVGGRFGAMIEDLPLVVSLVLLASLIECFLVLPHHMRHATESAARRRWWDAPSRVVNHGLERFTARAFRPFMGWVIRLRYPVLAGCVLLLAVSVQMLAEGKVPWRFWSAPEGGHVHGNIAMLSTATRDDTLEQMRLLHEGVTRLRAEFLAETGVDPIRFVVGHVGGGAGRGLAAAEGKDPWLLGALYVELIDADHRPMSQAEVTRRLQDSVVMHPLAEIAAFRGGFSGPGDDSLSVRLSGADPGVLKAAAEALREAAGRFPQVSGLEDSLGHDKTEQVLDLTPLGRSLGFTPESLGATLSERLTGVTALDFPAGPRTGRIRVVSPEAEQGADFLHVARVRAPSGDWVALSAVATATSAPGFAQLRREDGRLSLTVTGQISEDDPAAAAEIDRQLRDHILPDLAERFAVEWEMGGLKRQEARFLADARAGAGLAVAGIFLTLAWVFGSWSRPLAILLVVPFGLIGAVWGHHWMGSPFTMFSVVGLIGMIGIVINDSIVLITAIDAQAKRAALRTAVLDATCGRLRAVLLTTLTTVLGLTPLLFEQSSQAQFLKPTVITLAFGLGFGMFLVLLVTPALVMLQHDVGAALRALRRMARRLTRRRPSPA